jgi:hypothetical protein
LRPNVVLDWNFPANWRVGLQQPGGLSLKHLRIHLTQDGGYALHASKLKPLVETAMKK